MTELPRKIHPCPIKEAVFELRFDSSIPDDAIFGIVFNQFKNDFNNAATPLPILEIPSQIRNQDPNLMFSPHYKMENSSFTMQIGPKVISLVSINEYSGWDSFQEKILDIFTKLQELKIITRINRLALRYINIFPDVDVFEKTSVKVMLEGVPWAGSSINVSTEVKNLPISSTVRIISGAQANISNELIQGSIIDIDSSIQGVETDCFLDKLNQVHDEEKKLFYKIIGSEYLESLTVDY